MYRVLVSKYVRLFVLLLFVTVFHPGEAIASVNVNTADRDTLISVPKIGEATADKILNYRATNGDIANLSTLCGLYGKNGIGVDTDTCKTIGANVTFTASNSVDTTTTSDTSSGTESSSSGGIEIKPSRVEVDGLVMTAPKFGFVGQEIDFDVEPSDGTSGRLVRYSWSFGDGSSSSTKSPTHTYDYPGRYVVVVESYYLKEYHTVRQEIEIQTPKLSLSMNVDGSVSIKNTSSHEVDLGGMRLVSSGELVFPKYSILLSGANLIISASRLGGIASTAYLQDWSGTNVASTEREVTPVAASASSYGKSAGLNRVAPTAPPTTPQPTITPTSSESSTTPNTATAQGSAEKQNPTQSASVSSATGAIPPKARPYLALLSVISIALFGVYSTKSS